MPKLNKIINIYTYYFLRNEVAQDQKFLSSLFLSIVIYCYILLVFTKMHNWFKFSEAK